MLEGAGRRTATDDAGRQRPAGDAKEVKKAKKKLITQAEAAAELRVSVKHVKRIGVNPKSETAS
jgi:hypothetical protein